VPQLEAAGYVLRIREPDWFEHRLSTGPDTDVNLHVFGSGAAEVERMLRFRDRLRGDDAARDRYARTRRELARRTWRHVQDYADAKTAVVEEVLGRAERAPVPGVPHQPLVTIARRRRQDVGGTGPPSST
jgi:GrpB-like predicted nucleotidyltransferase (UPF0157 family)